MSNDLVMIYIFAVALIIGYLAGNVHGAFMLGEIFKNMDIRKHGSGNSGTTNALRVFGLKLAIQTFVIDFFKAFLPVFFASNIANFMLFEAMKVENLDVFKSEISISLQVIFAIGVLLGHNYPFVLKFKGGKGIACTVGILAAINLYCGITFAVMMIAIIALTRYVSLASIISAICTPIMIMLYTNEIRYLILGLIIMVLAVYRHKANIVRLKNGTESKIGEKAKV